MPIRRVLVDLLRVCVAGLLLAGCAGAPPAADADPTVSAGGGSATPLSRDVRLGDPVIGFAVEGGFTGQTRSLDIDRDGAALVEVSGRSVASELDAAQVDEIVAELEASGLFDRDRVYPAPEGADLQRFKISYDGATIVAYDTTVPPELTEAVRLLEVALRDAQR